MGIASIYTEWASERIYIAMRSSGTLPHEDHD